MSASEPVSDRVVAITGATGNLGPAVVRTFADAGDRLAIMARDAGRLDVLVDSLPGGSDRHLALPADLSSATGAMDSAAAVGERLGPANVLLHLVGTFRGGSAEATDDDWRLLLDVNLWSTVWVLRAFLPQITSAPGGRIVTVSSPFAQDPSASTGAYGASKAAVESLTLAAARETRASGATANVVLVRSIRSLEERAAADPETAGAWTTPEEIGQTMLWLCSPRAAAVNGARVPLYGGG